MGGLRLPLNAFAREVLHKLGIGINQLNLNAWRLIISMQVLWRKIFDGNHPLTMDEFLYCYKPFEISQSLGFYQFYARGSSCRLVKSLPTSDRRWKTEFFFILGFWARNLIKVGRDPFPPYTGEMSNIYSEGMLLFKFHTFSEIGSQDIFKGVKINPIKDHLKMVALQGPPPRKIVPRL